MAKITYYTSAKQLDDSCKAGFAGRMTTFETCGIDKTQTENRQPINAQVVDLPTTDIILAEAIAVQMALEHGLDLGANAGTRISVWVGQEKTLEIIQNDLAGREDNFDGVTTEVIQTIRGHLTKLGRKKTWPIVQMRTNQNSISSEITEAVGNTAQQVETQEAKPIESPLTIVAKLRESRKNKV